MFTVLLLSEAQIGGFNIVWMVDVQWSDLVVRWVVISPHEPSAKLQRGSGSDPGSF